MCLNPSQCSTKICWKTFQSCAGAASMRAHRVGVVGCMQGSFCTTSHHLSPPPHRPSPRHAHLPLSPLSHGDFRPVAKCKFLDDQAGTWSRSRRVVIKVEVSEQGVNTRFVVTDLEQARTKVLYQKIYCARGQAENEIKDHKLYLKSDRTSCHRFEANQLRVLLHSAAYVLLETLRREVLRTTQWAAATMETIQLRLLKLGARVQECKDRIMISLPSSCPVAPVLRRSLTLLACVRLIEQAR